MTQPRQLVTPGYLVAFTLLLVPPFDAIMQVLPLRLHEARWRFGAFGLMSNAMMLPMIGLVVAFAIAAYFEHRRFQRVLGVIAFAIAGITVIALAAFLLDALQVRRDVNPKASLAFTVATATAVGKSILGVITLGAFGFAGFRGPKSTRHEPATSGVLLGAKPASAPVSAPKRPPANTPRPTRHRSTTT